MTEKIYVDVIAMIDKEGKITPLEVVWSDGKRYEIDKIKETIRSASLKAGGTGIRYTCIIHGKEKYLFFEDINPRHILGGRWFVEGK